MLPSNGKRKFMDNSDTLPVGFKRPDFESGPPFFGAHRGFSVNSQLSMWPIQWRGILFAGAPFSSGACPSEKHAEHRGGSHRRTAPPRPSSFGDGIDNFEHTGILKLRGLPYSAGQNEVAEFFEDYALLEDRTHICLNSDGRPSAETYVEFATPDDSKAAMEKDRMTLRNRYIELFPATHEEVDVMMSG